MDVIRHVVAELAKDIYEVVVYLQPTSPLRNADHIDQAVGMLTRDLDGVVSVVPVPHAMNPGSLMERGDDGLLHPLDLKDSLRRQDRPQLYARNGPAVLVLWTSILEDEAPLYSHRFAPYPMTPMHSIDIDDPSDVEFAEAALSYLERSGKK